MRIVNVPIKNFDSREGIEPEIIVVHITDDIRLSRVLNTFNNPREARSSHYLILESGTIYQLVDESKRSWGVGKRVRPTSEVVKSRNENPNNYAINIEIMCIAEREPNQLQYNACIWLVNNISKRNSISLKRNFLIGHNEIRADKACPARTNVDYILYKARELRKTGLELKVSLLQKIIIVLQRLLDLRSRLGGRRANVCSGEEKG